MVCRDEEAKRREETMNAQLEQMKRMLLQLMKEKNLVEDTQKVEDPTRGIFGINLGLTGANRVVTENVSPFPTSNGTQCIFRPLPGITDNQEKNTKTDRAPTIEVIGNMVQTDLSLTSSTSLPGLLRVLESEEIHKRPAKTKVENDSSGIVEEIIEGVIRTRQLDNLRGQNKENPMGQKEKKGNVHSRLGPRVLRCYRCSSRNFRYPYPYGPYGYFAPPPTCYYQYPGNFNSIGRAPFHSKTYHLQPPQKFQATNEGHIKEKAPISPIPNTYTELLPQLLEQGLVQRLPYSPPFQAPYPAWYNTKAHCDYHSGTEGHATEDCFRLKQAVQALVIGGRLNFHTTDQAVLTQKQVDNQVSVIGSGEVLKRKLNEVETPFGFIYKVLTNADMLELGEYGDGDHEEVCPYHGLVHGIRQCREFRVKVQKLMEERRVEFYSKAKEGEIDTSPKQEHPPVMPDAPMGHSFPPMPYVMKQF
ncbi:hypothetical protein CCACVL1_20959 [Corchorus capsularis]|uniref:Uncharacterized protein n=1 Tax=Corchorus capsularis TaxID=210143 RepID=A0A1R3H943_COCAP|nr:hypothetical protein CCACVL1_20959 [Corchorus capsularis]